MKIALVNMTKDNSFTITFKDFYSGFSPIAHLNSLTEKGTSGHASAMVNADILDGNLTQGQGLANLTNGTQAGAISELINFIYDKAVAADVTYGIGTTKLFKISSTAVTNDGTFPHTITGCADGESVVVVGGKLYYFYNKSSGGEIGQYDLSSTFDDDWGSTIPTGKAALQKAPHPSAVKEDIIIFGNGRYLGTYFNDNTTLDVDKLDFGTENEVDDVLFFANQWWIAVNSNITGTNKSQGQIFIYDGGAISSILSDETGVGLQRIGWLYNLNGIIYVCYQDLSTTGGYKIGWINGRQIKPLAYFTGSLPNFAQKTLYKNTILTVSNGLIYSFGATIDDFPIQISQIADGGYSNVGALSAPFGTPMVASCESTTYKLAKFSGYETTSSWRSIIIPLITGRYKGFIDRIVVLTNSLGANARADLQLETNQNTANSGTAKQITGTAKRRHIFQGFGSAIEDFRIFINFANGSTSNNVSIRRIDVEGHWEGA